MKHLSPDELDPLHATSCTVELLCDVVNPFVGKYGAARVFAPQKGASAADVEVLEKRMEAQAFTGMTPQEWRKAD